MQFPVQLICYVTEHDHESAVVHGQGNSCEQLAYFITILIARSYNNLCELPSELKIFSCQLELTDVLSLTFNSLQKDWMFLSHFEKYKEIVAR